MFKFFMIFLMMVLFCGCGGTYQYQVETPQEITITKKIMGTVSFQVSAEEVYHHKLGINHYNLHVKDAIEKQFSKSLAESFEGGLVKEKGDIHLMITALSTSTFPLKDIINDIRLFFRVEVFNENMQLQKTVTIYGFGTDPDGNIALAKAVANMYYLLLPTLEELFIR